MGDYDRKPMEPPSQFLRLKTKGDECRIRIASAPYRELKIWPAAPGSKPLDANIVKDFTAGQWMTIMRDPNFTVNEVFHFVVIDRADSGAKIFTTTGGVYGRVRDLANNPEWGDPKGYDLTITRTEQPGKNYYDIVASPNKFDLTADERQKVDALNVREMLPNALSAASVQPDDIDAATIAEPLPWDKRTVATPVASSSAEDDTPPANPDEVIEPNDDEPINLDDIPF